MAAGLYPAEQALITLGAAVGGIAKSYGTAQWFDQILPVELPCLIVIPSTKEAGAWGTSAFLGNAAKHQFGLEHWLLYRQIDATPTDRTTLMPSLLQLIDSYLAVLATRPFIGSDLSAPPIHQTPKVVYGTGTLPWGEGRYHGVVFKYQLEVNL